MKTMRTEFRFYRYACERDDLTTQRQLQRVLTMDHAAVVAWLSPIAHTIWQQKPVTIMLPAENSKSNFVPFLNLCKHRMPTKIGKN